MDEKREQEAIIKILQRIPIKTEELLFNIKNIKNIKYKIYNFSQTPEKCDGIHFESTINEINQIQVANESVILFDLKKICDYKLCILLIDSKIIIINKSNICYFRQLFEQTIKNFNQSNNHKIFILTENAKKEFQSKFNGYKCKYSNLFSSDEIKSFENNLNFQISKENENFLFLIKTLMSNFILLQSYYFAKNYKNEINDHKQYNFDDFIFIRNVGDSTDLYFNINDQLLCILKGFCEQEKQYKHELEFYQTIGNKHPFISKYFGHLDCYDYKYIVIEFIEGETLVNIIQKNINHLSYSEKIKIIIEILLSVEYIHSKNIFIRDLKWDNIIIDSNHDAFLIDFDYSKVIESNSDYITGNIGSDLFAAPEQINSNDYTYKVDLYSIGILINFIITGQIIQGEDFLNELKNELPKFPGNFLFLTNIYKNLLEYQPDERPNISTVTSDFLIKISGFILANIIIDDNNEIQKNLTFLVNVRLQYLNEIINQKSSSFIDMFEIYNFIGTVYFNGKNVQQNLEKALYYFKLSADFNNPKAQCNLGSYYYKTNNVENALNYLNLSANQNYTRAFFILGGIYFEGKLVKKDIQKVNYYFEQCGKIEDYFFLDCLGYHYYYNNNPPDINKSIYYLQIASKLHNPKSQCLLGLIYFEGKFIKKDIDKAIHYFSLSANQNNAPSKMILGQIITTKQQNISVKEANSMALINIGLQYCERDFYSPNINKTIEYFTLASQLNNSIAQYFLGFIYTINNTVKDINKAIYYLTLSANNNNQNAQYYLAINYLNGKNFPQKVNKGIQYLDVLSKKYNDARAQLSLGYEYLVGKNISKNVDKAINYISLAAKQNNQNAQILLGDIYSDNTYHKKDLNNSIKYYSIAANQNNCRAQFQLGIIYLYEKKFLDINKGINFLTLSANQNYSKAEYLLGIIYLRDERIKKNINKSIHYLNMASQKGNSKANFELGFIYLDGIYVPHDLEKAIYYFTLSSNQNNSRAQFMLFNIYYDNKYHSQDINKSIYYLKLSANQYFPQANFILGALYYEGKYLQKDIKNAIHYYKEARNMNNCFAINNLGVIYLNGIGVQKNIFIAIEYFEEAINKSNDIFSIYNLSRIYYFGINCDKNVIKAINILKKASNHIFLPLDIFLFLIFYIDNDYKNIVEARKCRDSILKTYYFDILLCLPCNEKCIEILNTIRDDTVNYQVNAFDSFKSNTYQNIFQYKTVFPRNQNDEQKPNHDINNNFYEGFYNK